MPYLRVTRQGRRCYYYIMRSERHGDRVVAKVCEYLGRDPEPERLKKALANWGVNRKRIFRRRAQA